MLGETTQPRAILFEGLGTAMMVFIKLSFGPAGQAWPSVRGHGERQQRQHRP